MRIHAIALLRNRCHILSAALILSAAAAHGEITLKDSDRVLFCGSHLVWPESYGLQVERFVRVRYPKLQTQFWNWGPAIDSKLATCKPRILGMIDTFHPTVVVLNFGLMDAEMKPWGRKWMRDFSAELVSVIEHCKSAGAKVILVTPNCPDVRKKTLLANNAYDKVMEKYAAEVKRVAEEHKLPVIDWYEQTAKALATSKAGMHAPDRLTETDGLAPAEYAHSMVARDLLKLLLAEPHQVTITVDWAANSAMTTAGTAAVSRVSEQEMSLTVKEMPLPWYVPGRVRLGGGEWPGSEFCRYELKLINAPPGSYAISGAKGAPAVLTCGPADSAESVCSVDLTATQALLMSCPALGPLIGKMVAKNRFVDRMDRAIVATDPQLAPFRQATAAELDKMTAEITGLPRTTDLTLSIKSAAAPASPK